jgi:hypothetical protein
MSRKIRSAGLVLALSTLFVSSAYALPRSHTAAGPRTEGFLAAAWNWFVELVLPAPSTRTPGVTAIWGQAGSQMDPNGSHGILVSKPIPDSGIQVDPDGHK